MATLVDSSVWIDFTRARSSQHLKQFIAPYILAPGVALAEPVAFEVLRYANELEAGHLREQFRLLPLLPTPYGIWDRAAILGQNVANKGSTPRQWIC